MDGSEPRSDFFADTHLRGAARSRAHSRWAKASARPSPRRPRSPGAAASRSRSAVACTSASPCRAATRSSMCRDPAAAAGSRPSGPFGDRTRRSFRLRAFRASTLKRRRDLRRKVLGDELAAEEKFLADARTAFGNGAPQPLPEEQADAEKYRQRIARLRQEVQLHERNIEALKKELGNTR